MASNTEKESQIALQALLQIGSNGQEQKTSPEAGAAGRGREGSLETSDIFRGNGNPSSSVANISHLLRMGASPSALLQQAQSRFGYSAAQMARIRAAAEASLRNNSNVANSLLSGFGLQRSFLESSFATQSPATSPPVLPRSPLMTPDRPIPLELQSPSFQTPKNSFAAAHPATPSSAPTTEEKVRKEEVEAALRSKPQRGKKRENLNAEERLELTRTRNREHAKSTRIRKKQRYQELLDTELKYLELQNTEDLNSKRRETIMAFFSAREKMLNRLVVDSVHSPAKASAFLKGDKKPSGNPSKEESQVTPQSDKRGVSFDASEFAAGQSRKVTPAKAEEDEKTEVSPNAFALSEIVEDIKHFKFESTLVGRSLIINEFICSFTFVLNLSFECPMLLTIVPLSSYFLNFFRMEHIVSK